MTTADEFQDLGGGVFFWQAFDPAVKTDLSCVGIQSGDEWYFIDPIRLAASALDELTGGRVRGGAILLTNGNHERAARKFRDRFSLPVIAHADAAAEFSFPIDRVIADGENISDQYTVIALPGAAAGEVAYLHRPSGTLSVGDALIQVGSHGFSFLPAKYCRDARELRLSLARLLDFSFARMTFAHGTPLTDQARCRLEALLASR